MGDLADRPLADLLSAVAESTAAPGGGCSAAWSAAIAAGLIEMSASLSIPRVDGDARDRLAAASARATELRAELVELGERELTSYEPVLLVLRRPADEPGRREALREALSAAAASPIAIVAAAAEVAELAAETTALATTWLHGDARTGVLLAEGACAAAAGLVAENLTDPEVVGDGRLEAVRADCERAAAARASVTGGT